MLDCVRLTTYKKWYLCSYAVWYNSGNVNWAVLFFASHDIEAKTLASIRQFNHTRVSMAFCGGERGNSSYEKKLVDNNWKHNFIVYKKVPLAVAIAADSLLLWERSTVS